MFKKKINRSVSADKIEGWIKSRQPEKVVELLQTGDVETRLQAVESLAHENMANIKRELIIALQDPEKEVALKVAETLYKMGVTAEEKVEVEKWKKHWLGESKPISKPKLEDFLLEDSE